MRYCETCKIDTEWDRFGRCVPCRNLKTKLGMRELRAKRKVEWRAKLAAIPKIDRIY